MCALVGKLDDKFKFKDNEFYESKQVLEAYVTDKSFREIIDNKKNTKSEKLLKQTF